MATQRRGDSERGEASASLRSLHGTTTRPEQTWLAALDAWHALGVYGLVVVSLAAVGALDWVTGSRLGFSAFYLIPIAAAAWRLGRTSGLLWATAAAITWLAVDASVGTDPLAVELWNTGIRWVVFAVVAVTLAELRHERDTVRTLAGTDQLTGVQNARSFRELVELERSRALRYNRPFTLAYLDVDGFRVVNERWGHTVGDQTLRLMASAIRENIRSMDTVARMGGDEFALLFPETGQGGAEIALGKIQAKLTEVMGSRPVTLTYTMGGVICVGAPQSVDDLIHRAEALMYAAKRAGGALIKTVVLDENFGIEAILQRS